jgi:NAD(P)-dependent dehydrogenase (short-subunit alcohol dehydrogenase family)
MLGSVVTGGGPTPPGVRLSAAAYDPLVQTDGSLVGRNVVVTGASKGIGEAVALRAAAEGANVVVNSSGSGGRDPGPLLAVAERINIAGGGRAVASVGPVEDYDYAGELVATCVEQFGSVDALFAVAGVPSPRRNSILDIDPDDWRRLLAVHLDGTFNCCRHAAPLMAEQGHGAIVTTSSDSWLGDYAGTAYPAAKGAIVSLTWSMARDLAPKGVRCNAIAPGARTPMASGPGFEARIDKLVRAGTLSVEEADAVLTMPGPEFVAPLYVFLASDAAEGITGRLFRARGTTIEVFPLPSAVPVAERPVADGPWTHAELVERLADLADGPTEP